MIQRVIGFNAWIDWIKANFGASSANRCHQIYESIV